MRLARLWSARTRAERRRESRRAVAGLAVDSPAIEVELVDASDSGLGVESERPLRIGVVYPFRLRRDGAVSEVYGTVRWCAEASANRFRAGVAVAKTIGPPLLQPAG